MKKIKLPKLIALLLFIAFTLGLSIISVVNFFAIYWGMQGLSNTKQMEIALIYSFCTSLFLSISVILLATYVIWINRKSLEVEVIDI